MVAESLDFNIHLKKNERIYRFSIPYGAPYEEVHEITQELSNHLKSMEEKAKQAAESKAKEQPDVSKVEEDEPNGELLPSDN